MGLMLGLVEKLCNCLVKMVSVPVVGVAGLGERMSLGEDLVWVILFRLLKRFVKGLDKFVTGQERAIKALAVAVYNHY
ncbi:hypothetical protein AgCh_005696 [Apium graveolens]